MENEIYFDNSFTKDVGFQVIKDWLSTNSQCIENKDYFLNLRPSNDKKFLLPSSLELNDLFIKLEYFDNGSLLISLIRKSLLVKNT